MRFGVNYTPSAGWFHSWLDFDADAVQRDLEQVASLGVDHVRIFPLWPVVQPARGLIRRRALDDVAAVLDAAAEFGLDVNVDALQGHLSSFDFMPSWLESWHWRNMFTDAQVVAAEADYVRALAETVSDRPNLLGFTLGNEVNQFAAPPHPTPHVAAPAQIDAWLGTMVDAARAGLGRAAALVTNAMFDAAWYDDGQPFRPEHAVTHGDATVVHSWVFNGAAQLHGALGAGSVRHAEYLSLLAAAWHTDAIRPVWLQEVGAPTNVVPVGDAPAFVEATVRNAAAVPGLLGITWWCSHDVARSLPDFPELEYDLGLIANDGRVKPTGERFAALARELRAAPAVVASPDAIVLDDHGDFRAACAPRGAFFAAWLRIAEQTGRGPQIALRSRLADTALLTARGIHALHEADQRLPA
jgi:Endoglucanase